MLNTRLVLVVEDTLSLARIYLRYLEQAGVSGRHAASLEEARDAVRRYRPDAVLCDLRLPDEEGLTWNGLNRVLSEEDISSIFQKGSFPIWQRW